MEFLPEYEHFIRARDELCARIVAVRTQRFGRVIKGVEFEDDPTMIMADLGGDEAPPMAFHLIYRDAKDNLTGRGFKMVRLATKDNDITVGGVCYLRSKYRAFRASRIVELTDLATGEVFEDGVSFFTKHPLIGPSAIMPSEEEKAIKALRDEVVVLTFIAASDGEIHEAEMDEIVKYVAFNWDEPVDENRLRKRIISFVPDANAFHQAMNRMHAVFRRIASCEPCAPLLTLTVFYMRVKLPLSSSLFAN